MSFKNGRNLWYVSCDTEGPQFSIPVIELESGATILSEKIARLKDGDIEPSTRWVIVAKSAEEAVSALAERVLVHIDHEGLLETEFIKVYGKGLLESLIAENLIQRGERVRDIIKKEFWAEFGGPEVHFIETAISFSERM